MIKTNTTTANSDIYIYLYGGKISVINDSPMDPKLTSPGENLRDKTLELRSSDQ